MINELDYFDFSQKPGKDYDLTNHDRNFGKDVKPLISIITPYYNGSMYIDETAKSVFSQTFPFWEWIIVNDGSTEEGTEEKLEWLKKLDSRIRVITQENSGPAKARYNGVLNAKSDIIFLLDADDLIDKTIFECGYFTLYTNKDAVWAYANSCAFGEQEYLWNVKFNTFNEKKNNIIIGNCFIRREKFLEVTEYSKLPKEVHEDWYMWIYFLSKGYRPVRMNFYGFWYRRRNSGRLNTINKDKNKSNIANKYINPYKKQIKRSVEAIQFPISDTYDYSTYPIKSNFIFKEKFQLLNKNEKNILFFMPWAVTGGADIFNLNLIKGLKEKGYNITIITTEPHEYMYRQKFEKYSNGYFDLTTFLKREYWSEFIHYIISTRNISVIFQTNSFYGYYIIPWLKTEFPKISIIDYLHAEDWSWRNGGYPRESVAISKYLDNTFTCTEFLKKLMVEKMGKESEKTEVVYIGVDTEHFDPQIEYEQENVLKEKYKNKKVILFPCRIVYLKRPIFMLYVLKELIKTNKNYICVFVGDGPEKSITEKYVKKLNLENYVDFIGMVDDIRPYYKVADITVIASLVEGLTLTAYESLSMGVPVVSSDVGGQKELINNSCGKIIRTFQDIKKDLQNFNYSKEEINLYVDAIIETLNKGTNIKDKCRQIVINKFSIDIMVDKIAGCIDKKLIEGTISNIKCNDNNIEKQYLVLFNELTKKEFLNYDKGVVNPKTQKIKDYLWQIPLWRALNLFFEELGLKKIFKKLKFWRKV